MFDKSQINYDDITPPCLSTIEIYLTKAYNEANNAQGINRMRDSLKKTNGARLTVLKTEKKGMEKIAEMERNLEKPDGEVDFRHEYAKVAEFLHKLLDSAEVKRERGEYVWPHAGYTETIQEIKEGETRRTRGRMTCTSGLSLKSLTEERNY